MPASSSVASPTGAAASWQRVPLDGQAGGLRRLWLMLMVACPAAGAAVAYGFLDSAGTHPTLKLAGAMVIAGVGMASLIVGRPVNLPAREGPDLGRHLVLVEAHPLIVVLAIASMATALIHFAVIDQHLSEYALYGWFFIVVGAAELAWAVWLVGWPSRALLVLGAAGNLLVAAVWVLSRTYGSLIGPEATSPAKVGFGDLMSTLLEAGIIIGSVALALSGKHRDRPKSYRQESLAFTAGWGVTLLTVLALYSAVGGRPFVSHVG